MTMILAATTRGEDIQPLGLGGQRVIDASSSIFAILRRSLSPAHAALFAEPEPDAERGEIDWYADGRGPVIKLSDVSGPQRAAIEGNYQRLVSEIGALATNLLASGEANERRLGELLMLALRLPGPDFLRVIDGNPVMIGWGHAATGVNAGQRAVTGLAQAREAAPSPVLDGQSPLPPDQTEEAEVMPGRAERTTPDMDILPPPLARWRLRVSPGWPLLAAAMLLLIPALWLLDHDAELMSAPRSCAINRADLASLARWRQAELDGTRLDGELATVVADVAAAHRSCPAPAAAPSQGNGA